MDNTIRRMTTLLRAVADPNRMRILKCLQARPACVCELVQALGLPQPRVSRHLKTLRDAGLVVNTRNAQWVEYALAQVEPNTPQGHLFAFLRDWLEDDRQVIADRVALDKAHRTR